MKNITILLCSFLLPVSLLGQKVETPYDFPVKPGTDLWAKLKTSRQMDSVCVIPDIQLKKLSTNALLLTCLNYPRILDFFISDNLQKGYNFYSKHFNGLAELSNRSDLGDVLINSYVNFDLQKGSIGGYNLSIADLQGPVFELLIAQETVINQYDKNEKLILLSEALQKLQQRQQLRQSIYNQTTSALIISRILSSEKIILSEFDNNGNEMFSYFNANATILNPIIIAKLIAAAQQLLFK